ncbi:MAG: bifunctional 4-hydroxy-2-oxoglutarate aldolase/2-dehydro-3-deoxy-phosphogluconate aldolase [Solirubrobacteraceae bacterium]
MTGRGVLEQVCAGGVIPVVVIDDAELAPLLGAALKLGGLPVVEVTFRTAGAVEALRALATDAELLVGAGTVVRPEQVDWARDAGASFVVTPGFSRTVVERCRELGMAVLPGVATASEVIAALDWGIDLVKFFPAEVSGGVAMLRALSAPFPRVRFVPTGGINSANAPAYLSLPSVAAVGGSWIVDPELLATRNLAAVERLASEAVRMARAARP